ncbi:MAG: PKD domain-containing protein, partial [Fluviicola sp.]
ACPTTSSATTVTVNPLPSATITASGPTTFCSGGSVILTANSGAGLSYQWQLNGSTISGETSLTYTANTSGNYTVVVTNSNTCSLTSTINSVTVNSLPIATITAASSITFCNGGSVVLNATTGSGLSYQWYMNGSILSGQVTSSYTANVSGNFYVVITNSNSCSATSNTISTTVNSNPIATISPSGSASICSGGSIILSANTGSGLTYQWLLNGSAISLATNSTYTASSIGNYQVIVTNSSSCSTTSTITTVSLGASPSASITAGGTTTFCSGNSVLLSANTGSGLTYIWKLNGTTIPSATASTYSATASGIYTVLVTNSGGCSTLSNTISVTVNPLPPSPSILNGTTAFFCPGGSVVLNSSSATGNLWSNSLTSPSITVNTPGTYTLSIVDGNGCQSLSSSACNVSALSAPPVPVITASGPTTFCAGGSVTLTSSASTNNHWSTTATSNAITVSTSGTYYVFVTNGSGCSSVNSTPVTVTVTPIPAAPVVSASGPLTFCAGQNVVLTSSYPTGNSWSNGNPSNSITVSNSGTYFVFHTDANGCVSPNSNTITTTVNSNPPIPTISIGGPSTICQGSNVTLTSSSAINNQWSTGPFTQSINVSTSGSYSVTVNNAFGCSSTSTPANITVIPTPTTPVITASGPLTFCEGDSILLSSSVPNTLWSNGEPDQQIYVSQTGIYSAVQVVSSCFSANSNIISVTVNPGPDEPNIVFLGDTIICQGEDVTLFVNSTSPFVWSTGDTSQVIDVLTTGEYFVTATAPNGCENTSDTVSITVVNNPVINFPFVANTCPLDPPFELNMATPPGGVYSGLGVNTGFFTPQNAGLGNHIISYTYTSPEGCIGDGIQVFEVESCLGIDDNDKFNLSVFPNPTNALTSISSSNIIDEVLVYDAKGRLIYRLNPNNFTTDVDLSLYESGMYFLSIQFIDSDETKIIRVVKTP